MNELSENLLLRRNPLITDEGRKLLKRLIEHPDAPRWNHAAGDGLDASDLEALHRFSDRLESAESGFQGHVPSSDILERVRLLRSSVLSFRKRIPEGFDPAMNWAEIATMSREDIAIRPEETIPLNAPLERMIVYRTAGTTGHALLVPHDPRAAGCYQPMIERALARHGILPKFSAKDVACFLVGAQERTVTYPTVLSYWNNAGFAKLNVNPSEWPASQSSHRYFADMKPLLLTGDPISFSEMRRMEIPVKPLAMVSTAVAMTPGLKKRFESQYSCPVIDWYSLTETGPIAYGCPNGNGYHVLAHDIFVEAVGKDGMPVGEGERGEITLTGGRNPFLPLLRYRTGDWGRMDFGACVCGDPRPKILDLEGRAPVLFRKKDGASINPVDISRALREFPLVQHEFVQHQDLSCQLRIRPMGYTSAPKEIASALRSLFGPFIDIEVIVDPHLGDREAGKILPYRSEILLED